MERGQEGGCGGEDGSAEGWMEGEGAGAGGFGGHCSGGGSGREGGGGDEEEMEENDGGHVAVFLNLVGYEIGGVGCTVNRAKKSLTRRTWTLSEVSLGCLLKA